jgi:hypothetical protein
VLTIRVLSVWWGFAIVVGGRVAAAEPPARTPVNLLAAVPTTVAVSSTVANRAILPRHLVDGDLSTAWNSRTDDLVGAWLAVRVPAGVQVTGVRITAGFVKRDPRLGDLFTANPRIKKVRVTHGTTVVERELDIENRGLQEIAIAGGGGDYRIEVTAIVPGTHKGWREICVSELELWGTPAARSTGRFAPTVRVGSLDPPPPLTSAECLALAGVPDAHGTEVLLLSESLAVCDVVRSQTNQDDLWDVQVHDVFAVALPARRAVGQHASADAQKYGDGLGQAGPDREVWVTPAALGTDDALLENAVLIEEDAGDHGTATLYAVSAKDGLTQVLAAESRGRRCTVATGAMRPAGGRPDLDVECGGRTQHYRFAAGQYVKR